MAYWYVDLNKTTTGDGSWANAFGFPDTIGTTITSSSNCVVCNTAQVGDEIRLVGRDYFSNTYAANTVYCDVTGNVYLPESTSVTGNGSMIWIKGVRPEANSGFFMTDMNGINYSRNYGGGLNAYWIPSMFWHYRSFANTTQTYLNSEVKIISRNSTLLDRKLFNSNSALTATNNGTLYFFCGVKSNTSITDNWVSDGVRETDPQANSKTIIAWASNSSSNFYVNMYFGLPAATGSDYITWDIPNTILTTTTATAHSGNSSVGGSFNVRYYFFNYSGSTQDTGQAFDIGAITNQYPYVSNVQDVLLSFSGTGGGTHTEGVSNNGIQFRLRSHSGGAYIYYSHGPFTISGLNSTILPANKRINIYFDTIVQRYYGASSFGSITSISANAQFKMTFGDVWSGYYHSITSGSYTYLSGLNMNITSTAMPNTSYVAVEYDRTRMGGAFYAHGQGGCAFPHVGFGFPYNYYPYALNYDTPVCKYIANGTITLTESVFYNGMPFFSTSTTYPTGSDLTTPVPMLPTQSNTVSPAFSYIPYGELDSHIRLVNKVYPSEFLSSFSNTENINLCLIPSVVLNKVNFIANRRIKKLPQFGNASVMSLSHAWVTGKTDKHSFSVDSDDNFGGVPSEYLGVSWASGFASQTWLKPLPVTACTDVVSTGTSLKFHMYQAYFKPALSGVQQFNANTGGGTITYTYRTGYGDHHKLFDIPTLSNTASKTVTMYVKRDSNTPIVSITAYWGSQNNSSTNTFMYGFVAGNTITNASLSSTYTQFNMGTFTPLSNTGNQLAILIRAGANNTLCNGSIYIDQISIT